MNKPLKKSAIWFCLLMAFQLTAPQNANALLREMLCEFYDWRARDAMASYAFTGEQHYLDVANLWINDMLDGGCF